MASAFLKILAMKKKKNKIDTFSYLHFGCAYLLLNKVPGWAEHLLALVTVFIDAAHFALILELCRGGAVTLKRLFYNQVALLEGLCNMPYY